MNQIKKLYELQNVEVELKKYSDEIKKIECQMAGDPELDALEKEYSTLNEKLKNLHLNKKDLELEADELSAKISEIEKRLYGGKGSNPKELLNLQQDLNDLKKRLARLEDDLLNLMENEEDLQNSLSIKKRQLDSLYERFKADSILLKQKRDQLEIQCTLLSEQRSSLLKEIDIQILAEFNRLINKKGKAVVGVEQGKCQGCHIALPVSDLKRARSGNLIRCTSCGCFIFMT